MMVQLPFSAAAVAVLLGAVVAGGAIGVMTSPPPEAPPPVQASVAPQAAPASPPSGQPVAEPPSPAPTIVQTVIETAAPPTPPPLQPQNVVQQTETATIVAAPVIVTSLGIASGCLGCIEHRNGDKAHRPVERVEHPAPQHAVPPRREIPPRVAFVRPAHAASVSAHSR